jgi:hypothetical protein
MPFRYQENPVGHYESTDFNWSILQEVGDIRTFWEYDFEENVHYQLEAQLIVIGEHCYIYMQDTVLTILGEDESISRCEHYKEEFDNTIYPLVTELTGDPDGLIGDIDGDPRIVILLSENPTSYYSQYNEIEHAYSNYCEMVYIYYEPFDIIGTIAHEFCHLIWFNYEFDEVHFILEGMAEYAAYYTGRFTRFTQYLSYFINQVNDSLIYFDIALKDYGGAYLFVFYLAERFGLDFLKDLVQQELDGAQGIEETLQDSGYNITFNTLYLDWITALILDDTDICDGQYGFHEIDIPTIEVQQVSEDTIFDESQSLNYYGFEAFEITNPSDSFSIGILGSSSRFFGLSTVIHDSDGWRVMQNLAQVSILQNISGSSIDTAYVMMSYMNSDAPSGRIDFGRGPSTEVEVSIRSITPAASESNIGNSNWILVGIGLVSIAFVLSVFLLKYRKH